MTLQIKMTLLVAMAGGLPAFAVDTMADFTGVAKPLRPALHSSGWAPRSYPRAICNDDAAIRAMNLCYARTHDWALVNDGQRVVDYQYVFPLLKLDPKDPTNYVFGPTDHLLELSHNVGLKIFYRLGTSIEHTSGAHFNTRVPDDLDKVAEIFAGIVRHYNRSWADGKRWDIRYWEIWNEPDGGANMWWVPGKETDVPAQQARFAELFVKSLKRLKAEFPEIKVGGSAFCHLNESWIRAIFEACRKKGLKPDFLSWHYYGMDVEQMLNDTAKARKLCDDFGFTDCELVLNEYHYLRTWDGVHGRNSTPEAIDRALDGPSGHNSIDAACFYLSALSRFHGTALDQAYWYGCMAEGKWGYQNERRRFFKTYRAACLFGDILRKYAVFRDLRHEETVTTLALESFDGAKKALLVTDYLGTNTTIKVDVKGVNPACSAKATVLDYTHDLVPATAIWKDGQLALEKPVAGSAAFLVTWDCK